MSKLNVNILASSSAGNCIVVNDGTSSMMLDAGLPYRKIAKKVRVSEMDAVLISHEHMDHYHAAPEMIRRGVDVYMSLETAMSKGISFFFEVRSLKQRETDHWYILPFKVDHDVPCLGYLIESKETGKKLLYVVDTPKIEYDFSGVNTWLIECNYAEDLLNAGDHHEKLKNRIRGSHFSLAGLKRFLGSSDLSSTDEIYIIHLSSNNSDEKRFIKEIQGLTGLPVHAGHEYKDSFIPKAITGGA